MFEVLMDIQYLHMLAGDSKI